MESTVRRFPEKFAWALWREANLGCPPLASSPQTLVPLYLVRHRLAPPIAMMTSMFLGRIVLLVSLFVLVARGQSDQAQCESGYEWVCGNLFERKCQGDLSQRLTFARLFCLRFL